ncbi:hypothetical protein Ais01nite_22530 [Asanoa ishikariensis]|uniref:Uncharacterized protein n=1 Tax=Asanoa ishikariensis TaxID=137265 RepID=A0A1H3RBV8_9ACTN|nr:hypothetical protein [Asanoa ishikariensis]GIF64218.1 hypothetical protein Ais01nite_22530 [Asanoa ishikariensis]SDZ22728.1 hypothetical protein SAMN05421684_3658 [Asanoa ishikariensis]
MTDYRNLMSELAATVTRRATNLAVAERAYHDGMAAAAAELRRAEEDAKETDRRAAAAASAVVEVDREAERLWSDLQRTRVWPGHRPGAAPEPAPATAQPPLDMDDDASVAMLARVAHRIHGGPPRIALGDNGKLPALVPPLLPFLGAAATAVTATLASALAALATLDLPVAGVLRLVGWLAYFASPFAGIPIATRWARRRWSARLDTGGVALIVLGGLTALSALIIALA